MKRKIYKSSLMLTVVLIMVLALAGTVGAQDGRTGEPKGSSLSLASVLVNDTLTPVQLAGLLVGTGPTAPTISSVVLTGDSRGSGSFNSGTGIVGFESGVILGSGRVIDVVGPNTSDATTTAFGRPGDSDLNNLIPGYTSHDATVLEFDFECPSNTSGEDVISFQYVFTSEEYNEFVNSPYNDVFGFFLNGTNIALLPDNVTPVSINNVNNGYSAGGSLPGTSPSNPAFYINNDLSNGGPFIDIEADGLTVVLGAQANIIPGVNHMRLAIADAGDYVLDSWVFIEEDSFVCAPLNQIPSADANGPYSGDEGSAISIDGTGSSDPDGDTLTYAWSYTAGAGVDAGASCTFGDAGAALTTITCTDDGTYNLTLTVNDGTVDDNDLTTVTVGNVVPVLTITSPSGGSLYAINTAVNLSGSFSDQGTNDTHTCSIDWDDGAGAQAGTVSEAAGSGTCTGSKSFASAGVYTIAVTVTDDDGDSDTETVMVVVYDPNAGFVTGGGWIDSPYGALRLQTELPFFNGSYYALVEYPYMTWANANDAAGASLLEGCMYSHLVTVTSQDEQNALYGFFDGSLQGKWYGGFQDPGEVVPDEGWNWVTAEPWDYTNWAPGEPNDGYGPGSEQHLLGWEGGWTWNDEGNLENVTGYVIEYEQCGPIGKATFGFVSKYKKGATIPTGNTEFQFQAAGMNFHSETYQWLVVNQAGTSAQFKGSGTINGSLDTNGNPYKFMLWAGDGSPDTFRIRIWSEDSLGVETVVYDNGFNQALGGGSIVIHKK